MTQEKQTALLQRRNFLKFIGKAGISLPLLQATSLGAGLILSRQAEAQAAPNSLRKVIFVYIPDGTPGGASSSFLPSSDLTLKTCSQPFESVKDECVFLQDMEIVGGGGHGNAQRVLGAFASGVTSTIDLALEETVGAISPVASLRLGVRTIKNAGESGDPISAYREWTLSTFLDNPQSAFETLFGGSVDTSDIGTKRRRKALDVNNAALTELKAKLGTYEVQRLDQHQAAIEKLRNDIDNAASNAIPVGCSNPQFNPDGLSAEQIDSNFTDLFALQAENAILALKCDITRVVTIQMGTHGAEFTPTGETNSYHSAIHGGVPEDYARYRAYLSERVAHLIQRLKDTDDPAGGKLIDSTLVVQVTDMGDGGAHTGTDAPFMLAGGGSAINRGSIVSVPNHHRLLDTVAQYMGVYGTIPPYDASGPVAGILA